MTFPRSPRPASSHVRKDERSGSAGCALLDRRQGRARSSRATTRHLFGWEVDANNPVKYGIVQRETNADGARDRRRHRRRPGGRGAQHRRSRRGARRRGRAREGRRASAARASRGPSEVPGMGIVLGPTSRTPRATSSAWSRLDPAPRLQVERVRPRERLGHGRVQVLRDSRGRGRAPPAPRPARRPRGRRRRPRARRPRSGRRSGPGRSPPPSAPPRPRTSAPTRGAACSGIEVDRLPARHDGHLGDPAGRLRQPRAQLLRGARRQLVRLPRRQLGPHATPRPARAPAPARPSRAPATRSRSRPTRARRRPPPPPYSSSSTVRPRVRAVRQRQPDRRRCAGAAAGCSCTSFIVTRSPRVSSTSSRSLSPACTSSGSCGDQRRAREHDDPVAGPGAPPRARRASCPGRRSRSGICLRRSAASSWSSGATDIAQG